MSEEKVITFEKSGVVLTLPESLEKIRGALDPVLDFCELDTGNGTAMGVLMYFPRTEEELNQLSAMVPQGQEPDEEAMKKAMELLGSGTGVFTVIGFNQKNTLESALKMVNPTGKSTLSEPVRIGSLAGFEYVVVTSDSEESRKRIEAFPPDMKEEFFRIREELLKNPQCFTLKPQKIEGSVTLPDTVVSFELEDLDGNKIQSETLLQQADITIMDVWRTWCHFCIEEFPDLDEIQKNCRDRGVQVVTVCDDAEDEELKAKARELTESYSFLTFGHSESFNQALIYEGTPTTYFLNREGKVLGFPVIGKKPEELKQKLNALLDGNGLSADQEKPLSQQVYTVLVQDQNETPVPGVKIGFCSDTQCNAVDTDACGKAVFKGEPYAWHIQVLKLPAGYEDPSKEDLYAEETGGTMILTLQKN